MNAAQRLTANAWYQALRAWETIEEKVLVYPGGAFGGWPRKPSCKLCLIQQELSQEEAVELDFAVRNLGARGGIQAVADIYGVETSIIRLHQASCIIDGAYGAGKGHPGSVTIETYVKLPVGHINTHVIMEHVRKAPSEHREWFNLLMQTHHSRGRGSLPPSLLREDRPATWREPSERMEAVATACLWLMECLTSLEIVAN